MTRGVTFAGVSGSRGRCRLPPRPAARPPPPRARRAGSGAGSGTGSARAASAGFAGRGAGGFAGASSSRGASRAADCAASKSASLMKLTSVTRIGSRSRGPNHGRPKTASAIRTPCPIAEILVPVSIVRPV